MPDKRCAAPKPPKIGETSAAAAVFRAMADPQRLRILTMIAQAGDEVCVCDINDGVPLLQPTVSHHLKVLRESGLITGTRRANWVYYRLADSAAEKLRASFAFVMPRNMGLHNASLPAERAVRRKRRVAPPTTRPRAVQSTR
jgi:ArsR family transcriptional regulator, arsenate/arsenite/antimonite-responsive transcriptional repressor